MAPAQTSSDSGSTQFSTDEWYRTQDVLVASRSVAQRALAGLRHRTKGTARDRGSQSRAEPSRMGELEVKRIPGTSVVTISARDASPERAAAFANAIARAYIERWQEERLSGREHALKWLAEQMQQARAQLNNAEHELLSSVVGARGLGMPLPEQQVLVEEEIRRVHGDLGAVTLRRIEAAARFNKLKNAQREDPVNVRTAEIQADESVRALQIELAKALVKQRELDAAAGSESVTAQSGRVRVEALRSQLEGALDGVVRAAQAELTHAQQVEQQLEALLKAAAERVREIQEKRLTSDRLERERRQAEQLLAKLREQAAGARAADLAGMGHPTLIDEAVPPAAPEPLSWGTHLSAAALLGALFGIFLCKLRKST